MGTVLTMPCDWDAVGVQRPLSLEHQHTVEARSIRLLGSGRVRVTWKMVDSGGLMGPKFSETFNLSRQKGKEKLKDFLYSLPLEGENGIVDLDDCLGMTIEVMAVQRPAGQSSRVEILHHLL